MPKNKSHSGAGKRFRVTGTVQVSKADTPRAKKMLGL